MSFCGDVVTGQVTLHVHPAGEPCVLFHPQLRVPPQQLSGWCTVNKHDRCTAGCECWCHPRARDVWSHIVASR